MPVYAVQRREDSYSDLIARVEAVYNRAGFCPTVLPDADALPCGERTTNKRWRKSLIKMLALEEERESFERQIHENERVSQT